MLELATINAMVIYFHQNEAFAKSRQLHKKFRIILSHQLIQPYLDGFANNEMVVKSRGKTPQSDAVRLKGKHFATSKYQIRKCCKHCGYKKRVRRKPSSRKTSNYCSECDLLICKDCFESFNTKSNLKR